MAAPFPSRMSRSVGMLRPGRLLVVLLLAPMAGCHADDHAGVRETWDVYYMRGTRIGYGHVRTQSITEEGRSLRQTTGDATMRVRRFGEASDQRMTLRWIETPAGKLVRFESRVSTGPGEMVTLGKPEGERLAMVTTTTGGSQTMRIDWQPDWGGFFAVEQSLERQPMRPGQRRRLRALQPILNTLADIELEAIGFEETPLLTKTQRLLRTRSVARMADGNTLETILWTDEQGRTLKSVVPGIGQESYRTTKEQALRPLKGAGFDLGRDLLVKVDRPIENPHQTRRMVYRLRLPHRDPSALFPAGPTQHVKALGPNEAQLTVTSVRPDEPLATDWEAKDRPGPADREPNALIESDDENVQAMARRVLPDEKDPWKVAQALESYVHEAIEAKDFSQAFSTAAEVAQTLQGDCTEHAVLLAALCRVRGIPARVAIGLIYYPPEQGFAYHMWNEVWIRDRWIPLDATLGRGGIGAAHIKLTDSNLHGAGAYSTFLPVLHVMGQLQVEITQID